MTWNIREYALAGAVGAAVITAARLLILPLTVEDHILPSTQLKVPAATAVGAGRPNPVFHWAYRHHGMLKNRDGLILHSQQWLPLDPSTPIKGLLFLVHGAAEHSLRYHHIAQRFTTNGFAVFSLDHQGHGQSEGERLHAKNGIHGK